MSETGEWVFKEFDDETGTLYSYYCSRCGYPCAQVYINYCGNCGSKNIKKEDKN